jgi:DNA-binding MarR family transcriptional regulator
MKSKTRKMTEATFGANRRGPVNRYGEYDTPPQWETQADYQAPDDPVLPWAQKAAAELAQFRAQTQTEPADWAATDAAGTVNGNGRGGMFTGPPILDPAQREAILDDPQALKEHLQQNELAGAPAGYTQVPNHALFNAALSPTARLVLMGLYSYDWKVNGKRKAWAAPSQGTLARYLGLAKRTVQTAIQELQAEGYLEVIPGGGRNLCNRYHLTKRAQEGRE